MSSLRRAFVVLAAVLLLFSMQCRQKTSPAPPPAANAVTGEPDYAVWNQLLDRYYSESAGFDYGALKENDLAAIRKMQQDLSRVDAGSLDEQARLAFWINLYNVNVVALVAENYPIESMRDLSTDPVRRLNVFDKEVVPYGAGMMSLNDVEHGQVRKFGDPRIHFAINCAAASCPPIRAAGAYTGPELDRQLDEQTRKFLNGPLGVEIEKEGETIVVRTTKIMEWFEEDFEEIGQLSFLRQHVSPDKAKILEAAGENVRIEYQNYDWSLNDQP